VNLKGHLASPFALLKAEGLAAAGTPAAIAATHEKSADGSTLSYYWADLTALPEFDRKLLAFFYAHVPPGTKKSQIRTLFRKNWKP
jgi:hypothetical protein